MKTRMPARKWLPLAAAACVCCALRLPAQTPPTITTQPASQTNLPGNNVTFNVAVSGTGPFTYQWQFNGTNLPNNIITTVAGNGRLTYSGDGGAATNAGLWSPSDIVLDASGNLYIADSRHNAIRQVDANGIIATVAGNGSEDYSGDGVPATNTSLYGPADVALDTFGNMYIADSANERIRKVDVNGIISTVAGDGVSSYSGDGGPATNATLSNPSSVVVDASGNVIIADTGNNRIRKVDTSGTITTIAGDGTTAFSGDDGAATNASVDNPEGVAFDGAGNLYIADTSNNRIRKVDTNGIITTVVGNGVTTPAGYGVYSGDGGPATNAGLSHPSEVAFDATGNLYIADTSNNRIRKVDTNGIITTVAGNGSETFAGDGGPATNASLNNPTGVALDLSGNLYIADNSNNRIREVHSAGYPTLALTNIAAFNGGNYTVVITSPYGSVTSQVASLVVQVLPDITVGPASQGALAGANPMLSAVVAGTGPFGYFWYFAGTNLVQGGTNSTLTLPAFSTTNAGNYTVVVTNAFGSVTSQVASVSLALPPSVAAQPASQAVQPGTNVTFTVAVSGTGPFNYQWQFNGTNLPNNIITSVAGNGSNTYAGDGSYATAASLSAPNAVAFDAFGNMYIADSDNYRVRKVDTNGIITTIAGNGVNAFAGDGGPATNASLSPYAVAVDAAGDLYIVDYGNSRIRMVDTNGIITTVAGNRTNGFAGDGGPATNASLSYPSGVMLDGSGNPYIADLNNNRIRKVNATGIINTVAGSGNHGYTGDGSEAVFASLNDPSDMVFDSLGNLYIADSENNVIRKVDINGIISTVAGTGGSFPSGDGGQATNAGMNNPWALAFDVAGDLFIADELNNRIRKVDTNHIITTVAGGGSGGNGSLATAAVLKHPYGVALDASGNLYIADTGDNAIREVSLAGHPTLLLTNVNTNNGGNYSVVISTPYGMVTSAVATLTLLLPPAIVVQPASQLALAGSNATFSVTATGTAPFYYSWYDNATNMVQSGTNTSYTVRSMTATNAGSYTVVVTNAYGSVTSQVATLTLVFMPTVATQPVSGVVLPGAEGIFSVAVAGTGPFTYQWQFNGVNLPNNIMSTVAGTGTAGFSGDGGLASAANLDFPVGVALDAAGNIYIADELNSRIRKVAVTNGIISTVAGTNSSGYSGDGGAAVNASLNYPTGVALDASGNLYIADNSNSRIRKVGANGIITTVAGTNSSGFSGDGTAAVNATLYHPCDMALDAAGDLFIADELNNRIRKVGTNGIITTVAGTNSSGYSGDGSAAINAKLYNPTGVAVDSTGQLFIADSSNNRIRKVDTNGTITTVAGGGSGSDGGAATNARLNSPVSVALDAFGNLYIADENNYRIRMVATNGIITTVAGNGSATFAGDGGAPTNASLYRPFGVALDFSDNIYIADTYNVRIRKALVYAGYPTLTLCNVGATNAGSYSVVISNAYGVVTSAVATLTIEAPPVFTLQPASRMVVVGSSPVLSVAVAGSGPFGYLCYFAGTNLVQSSTNGTLALPVFSATNAGNYTVVVTNAWGSVTSQVATLTAVYAPSVTTPPGGQAVLAGSNVSFSVSVSGTGPFNYQWQFDGTNLPNKATKTVAGNGSVGFSGDGGPATSASLNAPLAEAFDASGNLYIADYQNDRIRVVGTNGLISTYAGTTNGFSGDGGAATNAMLYLPRGVALDASGDLYISDMGNSRIRKVGANGIITTVAGNGTYGYSGNGGPATNAEIYGPSGVALDSSGNLYIADTDNGRVRMVGTNGIISTVAGGNYAQPGFGDGGPAVLSYLGSPVGVAFDPIGNLYIADQQLNRIRKVDTHGIITTFAQAELLSPDGVAADVFGNVFIADTGFGLVLKVDTNGILTMVTPATNGPVGVCVDSSGNLYFGDSGVIREVFLSGFPTLTLTNVGATNAGSYSVVVTSPYGSVTSAVANLTVVFPPSVATLSGSRTVLAGANVVLSGTAAGTGPFNYQWQFDGTNLPANVIRTVAGDGSAAFAGDGGAATNASLNAPYDVAFDASGNLYVADTYNNRIRKVDTNGNISTVAGNGIRSYFPIPDGGTYSGDGGPATNAGLYWPMGLAVDAAGDLYVADNYNQRVREINTNNIISTVAGNGSGGYSGDGSPATNGSLHSPSGVVLDAAGNLYIADSFNNRVRRMDTNGNLATVAGDGAGYSGDGGPAAGALLSQPNGVAMDVAGNLYIADLANNRIRKVDTNGFITTYAGNGSPAYAGDGGAATNASLYYPANAVPDAFGSLYIADAYNDRIRKVDTNGVISTVAGDGVASWSGDGGPATNASLCSPIGVALDAEGNLYIADAGNSRVREVLLAPTYPALRLGNAGANNAGNYSLVITSPYGSVTSSVVTLNVAMSPPQIITSDGYCGFLTNQFGFNLSGPSGLTIVVDGSADLVNWTPLFTNTCGSGNPFYFCDPCWTNYPWRFYRARLP